jgi:aquaporin Z
MIRNENIKPALAELVGTFTLVFIGAGAGALAGGAGGGGILAVALAHGIALMVVVYAWGAVSGAHVNPAVTFGMALTGKLPWIRAVWYWAAQFIGAIVAAYLLSYILGTRTGLGATVGSLTKTDTTKTILLEAVLTFFLVTAVFGTMVSNRNGNAAGIAIGFVLAMDVLVGGSLTGASVNPARTLGPAVATGDLSYFLMYALGQLAGAAGAALLYDRVYLR